MGPEGPTDVATMSNGLDGPVGVAMGVDDLVESMKPVGPMALVGSVGLSVRTPKVGDWVGLVSVGDGVDGDSVKLQPKQLRRQNIDTTGLLQLPIWSWHQPSVVRSKKVGSSQRLVGGPVGTDVDGDTVGASVGDFDALQPAQVRGQRSATTSTPQLSRYDWHTVADVRSTKLASSQLIGTPLGTVTKAGPSVVGVVVAGAVVGASVVGAVVVGVVVGASVVGSVVVGAEVGPNVVGVVVAGAEVGNALQPAQVRGQRSATTTSPQSFRYDWHTVADVKSTKLVFSQLIGTPPGGKVTSSVVGAVESGDMVGVVEVGDIGSSGAVVEIVGC